MRFFSTAVIIVSALVASTLAFPVSALCHSEAFPMLTISPQVQQLDLIKRDDSKEVKAAWIDW